jgi:hypothetical protein
LIKILVSIAGTGEDTNNNNNNSKNDGGKVTVNKTTHFAASTSKIKIKTNKPLS